MQNAAQLRDRSFEQRLLLRVDRDTRDAWGEWGNRTHSIVRREAQAGLGNSLAGWHLTPGETQNHYCLFS